MDRISVMPQSLADIIAAGEVVERPASALKELVENSIDAQASRISIEIESGGLKSITVRDDGTGMSRKDCKLSILRHASSKIKTEFDLMGITTMGFRGEALPSIVAVSSVRILTSDGTEGTELKVSGDGKPQISDAPLRKGTTIEVKDLFYNTPARLKYMKSPAVERAKCLDVCEHLALGFPEVAFDVKADGREVFSTTGRGDAVEVIQRIWGADIARSIVRSEGEDGYGFTFDTYCAKPEINYSSRYQIMTFINSRYIYSYRINRAVEEAYRDYLAPMRYPFCAVLIQADPSLVDVNVHPSKREVRISGEEELSSAIKKTISDSLRASKPIYTDRDTSHLVERRTTSEMSPSSSQYSEATIEDSPLLEGVDGVAFQGNDTEEIVKAIEDINRSKEKKEESEAKRETTSSKTDSIYSNLLPIGQVLKTYIVCDSPDGLYLIDQHAAAERINFEKYEDLFSKTITRVAPIEPMVVEIPPSAVRQLENGSPILEDMGITVEPFSNSSVRLTSLPEFLTDKNYREVIRDLILAAAEGRKESPADLMRKSIATIACKASVRAGDELSPFAQVALIRHLAECRNPANCPHGRPTGVAISRSELERLFRRSGF